MTAATTLARRRFHHLVLEARSALPQDPLSLLLEPLPASPMEAPVDLLLEARAARPGEAAPRLEGEPVLLRGDLAARLGGGAVELCGPGARITVDAFPLPRVVGHFEPAALSAPPGAEAPAGELALLALEVALRARGVFHLLAAALVLPGERTVLIPALAGAARRALAAALVAAGAELIDEEAVFVVRREGALRLLALPRPGRLGAEAAAPGLLRSDAPAPSLILLPRLTGDDDSRLEPAGAATALGQLLECSTLAAARGLPGGDGHLPLLGALADGARVARAELGLDLAADGAAVARRLLGELADA